MKKAHSLLFILLIACGITAQKNDPIFSMEECGVACLLDSTSRFAVIENIADAPNLAIYDAEKKELIQSYKSRLPENPIMHIIPLNSDSLCFITIKKDPENGKPLFDAIYLFNLQKDSLALLYKEKEKKFIPFTVGALKNKLVISSIPIKKQPYIFDLKALKFEPFSNDKNLRMIFADKEKNKYIVCSVDEVTSEDTIPIYAMDTNNFISKQIGKYCARLSFSTESVDYVQPGITVTDHNYDWTISSYERSGMPLTGFQIATRPQTAKAFNQFSNVYDISGILSGNNSYIIAEAPGGKIFIYSIKNK